MRSWAFFEEPLRAAIHSLKYKRNLALGDALCQQAFPFLRQQDWPIDLVTAVPLDKQRYQERGYNQAGLLARPLASLLGCRYNQGVIKKIRATRPQVGLDTLARKSNVAGAFAAEPEHVGERSVLLVDDVATTGATMAACAHALRKAGCLEIYGFTLARAVIARS